MQKKRKKEKKQSVFKTQINQIENYPQTYIYSSIHLFIYLFIYLFTFKLLDFYISVKAEENLKLGLKVEGFWNLKEKHVYYQVENRRKNNWCMLYGDRDNPIISEYNKQI